MKDTQSISPPATTQEVRCLCSKIVCRIDQKTIIIRCRHCKRDIVISTSGVLKIDYK